MSTIGEYEAWKAKQQESGVAAAQVVLGTVDAKPDEVAGDLNLADTFAKTTGSPPPPLPLVKEYRNVFQAAVEREKSKTILSTAPRLTEWLRNPENAAVSGDDLASLSWFEGFVRGSKNTLSRGGQRIGQAGNQYMLNQTAGRFQDRQRSFGEIIDSERTTVKSASTGEEHKLPLGFGDIISGVARYVDARYADLIGTNDEEAARQYAAAVAANLARLRATPKSGIATAAEQSMFKDDAKTLGQSAQNIASTLISNPIGVLSWALETAGESAPQMAAAVAATLVTRNPAAGVSVMTGGSYATERYVSIPDFLKDKNIDLSKPGDVNRVLSDPTILQEANDRGVIRGAVIAAFDALSFGLAGKTLARNPIVETLAQLAQQAVNGSLGEYAARAASGQEIDWNEILAEGLGEMATMPIDMATAGRTLMRDRQKAKAAEGAAATAAEISANAQGSALRARMPEKFRQFVEAAAANGPIENVFVPAEGFMTYFQGIGVDPYALIDQMEGVTRDDLDAALAGGGDLQIPTATYAAKIAGTEHDAFFAENLRFDPNEFTSAEAREFNARADEAMAEAWDVAERLREHEDKFRSFEQEIYDTMTSRLRAAGRSTDVATTEAMLFPAFYRVMAERSGLTVDEFMQKYPLPQVRGDLPEGMQLRNVDDLTRTLAAARSKRVVKDGRQTLLEFISDYGGINDVGGELRSRNAGTIKRGPGKKALKLAREAEGPSMFGRGDGKKHGHDDVAQAAIEAGFMADDPTVQEYRAAMSEGRQIPDITIALWDAIDRELSGETQFSAENAPSRDVAENEALAEVENYLASLEVSLDDDDDTIRAAIERDQAERGKAYGQGSDQNLIVQHNLSAAKLLHADKMRGLAVPSVAISNVDYPLDGFGEISLIGGPDLVDHRKDKSAKVFDADMYSPRYPTVEYKIDKAVHRKIWKRLDEVSRDLGHVLSSEIDFNEVERKGMEAFRDSSAVQLQFLRDTGRAVDLPKQTATTDYLKAVPELRGMFSEGSYFRVSYYEDAALMEAVTRAVNATIDVIHDAAPDLSIDELRRDFHTHDGKVSPRVFSDIIQEVRVANSPGVDRSRARQVVRDAVKPHADEFAAWVDREFSSLIAGERIATQSESGNWKYLPHTLDNVVKVMRRKLLDGEGFNYGLGSIRSNVANQFKSVKAIQAARGRLVPADAMQALKDEVNDEFVALSTEFQSYVKGGSRSGFFMDTFSEHLKEVIDRGLRSLDQYYADLPDDVRQKATAFIDKLSNMPSEYFEAKLQRAVALSEFKAAVIPKDAAKEVRDALTSARVPMLEYDPAVPGSRAAMMRRAAGEGGLLFQSAGAGPRGSIQFPVGGVGNGDSVIRLFQSANLTTMLHESGHYFLTVLRDLAEKGEGQAVENFTAVKGWWKENAEAVAKDAMRVMSDVTVTAADVVAAIENGTTGDIMKDAAIDVGMQEQWARAFEAYLMEGKSPSADLRSAFEKFRSWLISVYRKLSGLNVTISPDIRKVFDRMLASDEEIAKAQEDVGGSTPIFATPDAMGLSADEYAAFLKLRDQSEEEAKSRLLREVMAPIKRERDKQYREEKARVRVEVERDVNAMRQFRALEWMGNRRWFGEGQPADMPDIRLSKDILVDRYGSGILKTLPRGKQTVYAVEGGLDPDDAAGWFGFDSGDEMVRAMEKAPKRSEAIDAETDRLMRERHGDVLNDGAIESEALNAVHTDKRGQWIAAELKAIAEVSGEGVAMTAKEARHAARQTIARMRVRDAMAANRFLAAERKAGEESARLGAILAREKIWLDNARRRIGVKARAAVKGKGEIASVAPAIDAYNQKFDTTTSTYVVSDRTVTRKDGSQKTIPGGERSTTALGYNELVAKLVEAKRRQLLNHALYMEARKVADEVDAAERFVAKLGKKSTREKIAGAGRREGATIDYLGAIDEILERYDFKRMSAKAEERRGSLNAFVEAMKAAGRENELAIPDDVLSKAGRAPYKGLPVEELRGVIDTLKNLEHIATRWDKLIDAKQQRELDAVVDEIAAAFDANMPKRPPSRVGTRGEAVRHAGRQFLDLVLNAGTILREIDGFKDLGAAYRNIKSPIDEAMNRLIVRKLDAAAALEKLYAVYPKADRRRMAVREHIPELGYALSKWERIAVALNLGNDGNRKRLSDPKVKGSMTEAQIAAVIATLDARDADFVQSVWDYIGSFRGDIAAREKRATGVEPGWVEATPVEIGGKTLRGGYYPIKYDPRLSSLARDDEAQEIAQSLQAGRFGKAQTRQGHLKERARSSGRDVELDMSVMHRHVNQVIYDLELSEPVANAWRIIQDGRMRGAFREAGRQADFDALETWLKDVAEGELRSADLVGRAARSLKSNFTAAKLALNLSTVAVQVTGLSQTMVVVGKKDFARGIRATFRSGVLGDIAAKSPFMASRQTTFNKDIFDFYSDPKMGPVASRWGDFKSGIMGPLSFWLMTKVQFHLVDVPTWLAGYQQGLRKFGNDEAQAIAHADSIVKRAQASGLFPDRSAIERGSISRTARQNDVVRLFTTLGSYMFAKFNVAYERSAKAKRTISEEGLSTRSAREALSWTIDMAFLFMVEAVIMAAIKGRLPGGDDEEDDEGWLTFLARETGFSVLGTVPFVRDVASTISGFEGGGAYGAITKEVAAPFYQASQGEVDRALVKSIINGTGLATGLPSTQINRAVDAAWRSAEGKDVAPLEYFLGRMGK